MLERKTKLDQKYSTIRNNIVVQDNPFLFLFFFLNKVLILTIVHLFINPEYTVLHILSHCTSYSLFYFIICSYFHSHLYLYIYSLVLCFIAFYFFLHFPLSGPVLTYISLLIIPCMIVYVTNNKEP